MCRTGGCQQRISQRFAKNRELYTDFALLEPQNFNGLKCNGVPAGAVSALSAKLIRLDSRATPEALQAELLSLMPCTPTVSESLC